MIDITKFVVLDILKNKIIIFYTLLLGVFSWSIFSLEDSSSKSILSLLNIILLTVPLVSIIFSNIYIYNSGEFIELLVSQPVKRRSIWSALFLGLCIAFNFAYLVGIGIPVLMYIGGQTGWILLLSGMLITSIFVSLALFAAIIMRDKAKGIGFSIILWLFFTLIYDGLILFFMFQYADYPIEKPMTIATALNPIDLSRIQVLLCVDSSALMGYTGAIFKKLFGTTLGIVISFTLMSLWIIIPFFISLKLFNKKDL
ncbi:MAG: ABC transporter permease subunit [Saprospiraceae bacterium]|nr:ABC transporter permease subunit [Saprospiraceae bacterium]MCB9308449.1 ABC transporter permease subunit [Lewinellaceae bacterium]